MIGKKLFSGNLEQILIIEGDSNIPPPPLRSAYIFGKKNLKLLSFFKSFLNYQISTLGVSIDFIWAYITLKD